MIALSRFGIPKDMIDMIQGFYQDRTLQILEDGEKSAIHPQSSGIAQGCPLSPYLFIIMMSILLEDVDKEVKSDHVEPPYIHTNDILYADDTLILSSDRSHAQALLNTVAHFVKIL